MNLNQITLFVRVVETGSFAEAARLLDLPRSSVSRGVAALEKSLGVRLLQRTTRQLNLTEEGREYYQAVSRSLAGLDDAAAAVTHQQEEPGGQLRITASMDVGLYLLAPVTAKLLARYPQISVDTELTPRVVDIVQEGFDLALRVGKLSDSRLVARHLGLLHQGVFASQDYLAAHGTPQSVANLAAHRCISFMGVHHWRLIGPAGSSTVQIQSTANSDNLQFSQALVADGIGIGLLPLYSVVDDERLVRLLPDYATAGNPLQLVYPGARYLPKRMTLLRDTLLDTIPGQLANQCEKLARAKQQ
ncbi:MAG TPA: LysR family transcriptional regulator [Gammaproteobacteria bacterium]|nr:LysR family transcriptional regulator [Gammaproteobacteria bacterium]